VVWGVLRNPAYRGIACFGKTRISARTRVMRPPRRRGVTMPGTTASRERPRAEWMEIPVPALATEESFARAQELLHQNQDTIAPAYHRAECGAGVGQLRKMWVRLITNLDANQRT